MTSDIVGLAEAKAQLSELTDRAARGEIVTITKHGKPVAQLLRPSVSKKPVSLVRLQAVTDSMKTQQSAGTLSRKMRDEARY